MKTLSKVVEIFLVIGILPALSVKLLPTLRNTAYVVYAKIMAPPAFVVDAQGLLERFGLEAMVLAPGVSYFLVKRGAAKAPLALEIEK